MRRLLNTIIILILLYAVFQASVKFFGPGHSVKYSINSNGPAFSIHETFDNENRNYYLDIQSDLFSYKLQTFYDFTNSDMIIKDIKYYENNNYKCILPVFMNNVLLTDFICYDGKDYNYYHNIMNTDEELDDFIEKLDYYNVNKYISEMEFDFSIEDLRVVSNNILPNQYLWLGDYKGIYIINDYGLKSAYYVKLFNTDQYKRDLEGTAGTYYITADYSSQNYFDKFKLVDLTVNRSYEIQSKDEISFDSYIQGEFDESLYFIDNDAKKQFQINTRTKKIIEVGNVATGMMIFKDGQLERVKDLTLFNEVITFKYNQEEILDNYIKFAVSSESEYGYTYYYRKVGATYNIYRKNNRDNNIVFIFKSDKIYNMIFHDDYAYYLDGNNIKYYSDMTGPRILTEHPEIEFNSDIKFGVAFK